MGKKKEAAKLAAREAEIRAELERRAAAKKAKKKAKGKKAKVVPPAEWAKKAKKAKAKKAKADVAPAMVAPPEVADAIADAKAERKAKRDAAAQVETPAETKKRAKPLTGDALTAALAADVEAGKARREETDAEIKARVKNKAAIRLALATEAETIDRADADAVREYNALAVTVGVPLLTSDAEKAKVAKRNVAEEVATEEGREFAVGTLAETELVDVEVESPFAQPSDAEASGPQLEEGRNGYKIIQLDAAGNPDPKTVQQYTRVTTYVDNIDDKTKLYEWKDRLLAEGLALDAIHEDLTSGALVIQVRELRHALDTKLAKARKADLKGKLAIGELARIEYAETKAYKAAMKELIEAARDAAGANDASEKGTDLHALAEIADEHGMMPIVEKLEAGEISPTDHATILAYRNKMEALGAKVLFSEFVIVNDDLKQAGRGDRIISAKLPAITFNKGKPNEWTRPADERAMRIVTDLKSGSVEYGAGKIARQMTSYARGKLYDIETGERTAHRASRDVGLIFHIPQGAGTCEIIPVDLKEGARLLKLSGEVREARNAGKRTIAPAITFD